jgi:hypothetical protein
MLRRHLRGFNKSSTLADQVFDESAVCKWIGVPTSALYGGVWHGPGRSPSTSALRYPDVGLKHHRSEHSSGSAAWPCLLRGPHRRDRRKRRSFLKRERRAGYCRVRQDDCRGAIVRLYDANRLPRDASHYIVQVASQALSASSRKRFCEVGQESGIDRNVDRYGAPSWPGAAPGRPDDLL